MEPNMSPLAAVPSRSKGTLFEILAFASCLIFLMAFQFRFPSLVWGLTSIIAVILAFMIEEDAHRQTVDLFLLLALGVSMLLMSMLQGELTFFFKHSLIGVCLFRFLLAVTSVWLSCRSTFTSFPSEASKANCSIDTDQHLMGYLPIFMLVFIFSLGFSFDFISIVFLHATFVVNIAGELVEFYPALPYICISLWLFCELILWWLEYKKERQILWAFGGGDVLFLGLFSGYLGLPTLLALYFLSLFARVVFSVLQFFLVSKIASS